MPKRRKKRAATRTTTKVVRVGSAPAPIIRVSSPRAAPVRRRRSSGRRRSVGGVGGIVSNETVQMAIGGALYGFAVKQGLIAKLPAIPILGRTGTAAILLDYWSRHGGGHWAGRAARAAATIAGYQLGAEGSIQGDYDATTPGSLAGDYAEGDDMDGYEGIEQG